MVERGTWVALALVVAFISGCPEPVDEAGNDEVGEDTGESSDSGETDSGETDSGEAGVPPGEDDVRPPDDANPDGETSDETDGETSDETDSETGSEGECFDLTSADGVLPIVVTDDTSGLADDHLGSCGQFPCSTRSAAASTRSSTSTRASADPWSSGAATTSSV
jgi:hypothetical protein